MRKPLNRTSNRTRKMMIAIATAMGDLRAVKPQRCARCRAVPELADLYRLRGGEIHSLCGRKLFHTPEPVLVAARPTRQRRLGIDVVLTPERGHTRQQRAERGLDTCRLGRGELTHRVDEVDVGLEPDRRALAEELL